MLNNKRGLSRIEVFCIAGICVIAVFLLFLGARFYQNSIARGDDSLRVNTAESVARMNLASGNCIINNCRDNGKPCAHVDAKGKTTGYYDAVKKKILAKKTAGYNEYRRTKVKEKTYEGKVGTMIISVTQSAGEIQLTWEKGETE